MKRSGSSARGKPARKNVSYMPDSEIDFSDIPEATPEELRVGLEDRRRRLAGRPASGKPWRQMISIRLDPQLLISIRAAAEKADQPYQRWIHEALERALKAKLKRRA